MPLSKINPLESARRIIDLEAQAVSGLKSVLGPPFEQALGMMLDCKGRVVTSGMGKAGLVARKIAATLASTGTPSLFMHPAEGVHGDLGMVTPDDLVFALSHQGQTGEVLRIVPFLKYHRIPLIAVTSNADSDLARQADVALVLEIEEEACPLGLAPTSSTTAMMALGDTIALVLLEARGFKSEDYARFHPAGSLGRKLLTRVSDLMHSGADNPVVPESATLRETILEMTSKKLASTSVIDSSGKLTGFFTDGDLRRYLLSGDAKMETPVGNLMTRNPKSVGPNTMAVKALEILREHKIIELPVCDENGFPIGLIHLHDITRAGIV